MTFFNPFFPPFYGFQNINSTGNTQNANSLPEIAQKNNCENRSLQTNSHNLFKDTDTIIILAILFFLYNQEQKNFPLILCLFLLLFD